MVSEFIFNLTRFNPHATKLWNMNIFNLKDQFDLTSNLISNRFNIMKFHDVIIENSYMIETISNALPFKGSVDQNGRLGNLVRKS